MSRTHSQHAEVVCVEAGELDGLLIVVHLEDVVELVVELAREGRPLVRTRHDPVVEQAVRRLARRRERALRPAWARRVAAAAAAAEGG